MLQEENREEGRQANMHQCISIAGPIPAAAAPAAAAALGNV
jgi:hypothetical protein